MSKMVQDQELSRRSGARRVRVGRAWTASAATIDSRVSSVVTVEVLPATGKEESTVASGTTGEHSAVFDSGGRSSELGSSIGK